MLEAAVEPAMSVVYFAAEAAEMLAVAAVAADPFLLAPSQMASQKARRQ